MIGVGTCMAMPPIIIPTPAPAPASLFLLPFSEAYGRPKGGKASIPVWDVGEKSGVEEEEEEEEAKKEERGERVKFGACIFELLSLSAMPSVCVCVCVVSLSM